MKYYEVLAKCGHVRRNNYVLKTFYTIAESKKEAAYKVRWFPRVKHHHKDAIREVKEISFEAFNIGIALNSKDLYFISHSKQEQNKLHAVDEDEIIHEAKVAHYKKNHRGSYLRTNLKIKESKTLMKGELENYA